MYNFKTNLEKLYHKKINLAIKISNKGVKVGKKMSIAKLVKRKTKYDLKDYCEMRGLSVYSLYKGYVTKRARKILEKDGIKVA